MAVTNLYSNLPGHLVEFKDGGLQLTSTTTDTSSTKSLLILGTATDGPINEPVKIDATTVSQVFGKEVNADGYPNGATLTKYAKQAFKNGFDDVRCMRVTGSQAYTTLYGQETVAYETLSRSVSGRDATDGTGTIAGNASFAYISKQRVAGAAAEGNTLTITKLDGTEEAPVMLGDNGVMRWAPYQGFIMNAGLYPGVSSIKLQCKGFQFTGTNGAPEETELTLTATVTEEDQELEQERAITATLANAIADDVTIFTDRIAGTVNSDLFPILVDPDNGNKPLYDLNGFKVTIGGTVVDPDWYESSVQDGNLTISFKAANLDAIVALGLVDSGDVKVSYYPYEEIDIEETSYDSETTIADLFNATVGDSVLDISEMNDLTEAEITNVTVENVALDPTAYEVNNGILKITNLAGLNVGDNITVSYSYQNPITSDLELKVKSQWGGSLYKDATVEVKKVTEGTDTYTEIVFSKPAAKTTTQATKSFSYSSKYYQTVDDLVLAMKNDMNNLNMFEIEIVKGEGTDNIDLLVATEAKALSDGGKDGLKPTNNEMFKALSGERYTAADIGTPVSPYSTAIVTEDMVGYLKTQGAYQILENYNVDYIYPAGVYADAVQDVDPNSDFQRELALVCAVLTYRTKMTHGFIDVKPNSNTTLVGIDAYVAKLINGHRNIYYMTDANGDVIYDSNNKPMDIGWYTSVVVGPEVVMTSDTLGTYYGSPAIAYAALNAVIEPQSSPLNKALRNVNGIKFKFSNKQMDAIIGNRMVVFKLKNEGTATSSSTPYVVDGVTSGAPGCDYSDIAIVKVVTDVVDNIREVADPFIGEQNTVEQRNALSALISKRLSKLVELGEIMSYEFEVSATIQQQLLGEASIALTIIPAMTLKKITTVVALRAAE